MRHLAPGIYEYRRTLILKSQGGWCYENHLDIYATLEDAKQAINKMMDGTNTREPRVIGQWSEDYEKTT